MTSSRPARNLQIADILALQPGDRIVVHPVTDALLVTRGGHDVSSTARDVAHRSFAPPGTLKAENLEKILDCLLETHMVLRSDDNTVLQVLKLDAQNWRHLLKHEGAHVDLMVGGMRIARGDVIRDGSGDGLKITELVGRPETASMSRPQHSRPS